MALMLASYMLPIAMDIDIDDAKQVEMNIEDSPIPGDDATLDALAVIDGVIQTQHDCDWKLRLAYVQLIRLTTTLKSLIVRGSRRGRLRRTVGQGNATILIDIYVRAQGDSLGPPSALRQNVQKRLRLARRWADLIGGSIFLAAAYCSKADAIVKDFSVTNERIKFIASHALQACVEFLPKDLRNPMFSNSYIQDWDEVLMD